MQMPREAEQPVTAVAEYSPTAAALAGLRQKYSNAVFDVRTTAGLDEAIKARRELRTYRVDLEKLRKQIKAPALERCRMIDSEAARITTELEALENPIHEQIAAEEARKEAEREAKRQAEVQRVRDIQARIDGIRRAPLLMTGASTARIAEKVAELQALALAPADYAEFTTDAEAARSESLAALGAAYEAAKAIELEAARLAEERAALELQRQEQARREAESAAERKRQDDAARAEREQADRQAREQRDEDERVAREQRATEEHHLEQQRQELARQQAALDAQRREDERLAKLRADDAARQERERIAQEQREDAERRSAAEAARVIELAAEPRAALNEILCICDEAELTEHQVRQRVRQIVRAMLERMG